MRLFVGLNQFNGARVFRPFLSLVVAVLLMPLLFGGYAVAQDQPHVVIIGGDAEYGSRETCAAISEKLRRQFGFETTLIESHVGVLENAERPDKSIPGLEAIEEADLLILYIRMRIPPREQLDLLHEYFESGKPAIGMRTTTHAFTNDRGWCPRYFGGHYWSHLGGVMETFVLPEMQEHPILRGVERNRVHEGNSLYITNPLSETARPLVLARKDDETPPQVYAWINEYKPGSRQFFFTASHPEDFQEPDNQALLYNAIFWALEKEIPSGGVLGGKGPRYASFDPGLLPAAPDLNAPASAEVLLDGGGLSRWDSWFGAKPPRAFELDGRAHSGEGLPEFEGARWRLEERAVIAQVGFGDIVSRDTFTDYRLHLDFLIPPSPEGTSPIWRGNSGVYLNGLYEIQLLDSAGHEPDALSCGAILARHVPKMNAAKPAGQWQSLDVWFRTARYRDGDMVQPARATIQLNGREIHHNVAIEEPTPWAFQLEEPHGPASGPIRLQADSSPVRFANVWVDPLSREEAAEELPDVPGLTGQEWVDMNYGPFLSASLEVQPGNIANKGIAIRVDPGRGGVSHGREFLLFETDTLRYAAGWTGDRFIDWRNIAFNGEHGVHASILGNLIFSNPDRPGWAGPDGTFEDPRITGRDGNPYGPMPDQWGEWRGLYRHGDQVVLSYEVGGAEVLELPAGEGELPNGALTRTLNIGPRSRELVLQVAHQNENPSELRQLDPQSSGSATFALFSDRGGSAADSHAPRQGAVFRGGEYYIADQPDDFDFTDKDFSIYGRIDTEEGGTILSKAPGDNAWVPNGKAFFIRNGKLVYDIGWVGDVVSERSVNDGKVHDVVMTYEHDTGRIKFYIDGQSDPGTDGPEEQTLRPNEKTDGHQVRIGFTAPEFPGEMSLFHGKLAEVRFYQRALSDEEIRGGPDAFRQERLVASWRLDSLSERRVKDVSGNGHDARFVEATSEPSMGSTGRTVVAKVGGPNDLEWTTTPQGDLRLRIPAGNESIRLKLLYSQVAGEEAIERFAELVKNSPAPKNLEGLTEGGPAQWDQTVTTSAGRVGFGVSDEPYAVDEVTLPHKNPYHSWMRLGGFDFFDGGKRAAVCTWQGDVWIVDGLGGELEEFRWKRIATGLFQPLGVKIVDGEIYVTCRDQITRLHDYNGDGETDFYESFNHDAQVTEHFHEFAMDLQTDEQGNFYYTKAGRHAKDALVPHHGTLIRVSPDGSKSEIVANGFRAPNGVCVNGDGTFIISDQEGHWTPKNRINWVEPGGFYGYMMGYHEPRSPDDFIPPIVWIHNAFDRSPAQQRWVTSDRWGPVKGGLINLSYGTGEISLVLHEKVGDLRQGGVVKMPIEDMPTGIMRGRFHPQDGQLYACGLFAWAGDKTAPGGFYRIRYTGDPVDLPTALHATQRGIVIRFTRELDPETAADVGSYSVSRWQYRRTRNYGSDDYKISAPGETGRDPVKVTEVKLSPDGRSVLLVIPDMRPAQQMRIRYNIRAVDGARIRQEIMNTVHRLGEEREITWQD